MTGVRTLYNARQVNSAQLLRSLSTKTRRARPFVQTDPYWPTEGQFASAIWPLFTHFSLRTDPALAVSPNTLKIVEKYCRNGYQTNWRVARAPDDALMRAGVIKGYQPLHYGLFSHFQACLSIWSVAVDYLPLYKGVSRTNLPYDMLLHGVCTHSLRCWGNKWRRLMV